MTGIDSLTSFVPAAVLRRAGSGVAPAASVHSERAIVLSADVSGYTRLVADVASQPGGIEQVRAILDDSFGRLITAIEQHGGDIAMFAGDAVLATWPDDESSEVAAVVAAAAAQRSMADADGRIRMRIGVAGGEVLTWVVGGDRDEWLLAYTGSGISEASRVQTAAPLGGVCISPDIASRRPSWAGRERDRAVELADVDLDAIARIPDRAPTTFDADAARWARAFAPPSVIDRVDAGHGDFLADLRTTTTVMVRVPGFDAATDVTAGNRMVGIVQRQAHRHDGSAFVAVDEKGVTFMLSFGLPGFAHEDDADRAVSAAVAIEQDLGALGPVDGDGAGTSVPYGIGVATGDVFCGPIGTTTRRSYAVLGDAVNRAARLADAALDPRRPSTLCDLATLEPTRTRWEYATPQSIRVKGNDELITVAAPTTRIARSSRSASSAVPMVGRRAELGGVLGAIGAGLEGDRGSLVLIEGEAGLGKSVLLGAIRDELARDGIAVRTGLADELGRSGAFEAWADVFAGILANDVTDRESAGLVYGLDPDLAPLAPLLGPVLGVALAETDTTARMGAEERVAATRDLLLAVLRRETGRRAKLVVILEDAHWFDSASWGLLADAMELPGFVAVASCRVEGEDWHVGASSPDVASLLSDPSLTRMRLTGLTDHDVVELARAHLAASDVDDGLLDLLRRTCKGNPFFTVEVLAALSRRGSVRIVDGVASLGVDDVLEVPDSIQAAITARIDNLPADLQLTLKVVSVIGAQFHTDEVVAAHPTRHAAGDIEADLRGLTERQVVVDLGGGDFAFNHALTRDVAYHLMPTAQRRELHRALALHYEEAAMPAGRQLPLLAHHWLHAGDDARAVQNLHLASRHSLASGMNVESVQFGVRAAGLLGISLETDPERIRGMLPGELEEIARLMAGRRPSDLMLLPELIDERVGTGIGIVLQTMPAAHQSLQSELFALMALRNLSSTLRYGAGPLAPGVYAMHSIVMRGLGLDSREAYEFSELARDSDRSVGLLHAAVAFISAWFNRHWFNPVGESIPIALAGAEAGLAGPDEVYGSFNLAAATTLTTVVGTPLGEVIEVAERHRSRTAGRSTTATFHNTLESQFAKALRGATASPTSLTDDVRDESELSSILETHNYNQSAYYFIAKAHLSFLAGEYAGAVQHVTAAEQMLPAFLGQFRQAELAVVGALSRLADQRDVESAAHALAQLRSWCDGCASNFGHLADLVAGEIAAVEGRLDDADEAFAQARRSASDGGFVQWAALASERRGYAARRGGASDAGEHFADAAATYATWGATVKVAEMQRLAD